MCGIAGIFYFKRKRDAKTAHIKLMIDCMAHRGPDAEGIFVDDEVALGHRRLSIIDLSDHSNQPFHDKTDRYVTVFNGEIYNFKELRGLVADHSFISTGDTEVLVEVYAKQGARTFESLKGMFAFAIWDRSERELLLVRDRMGVKPLYYYQDDEKLIFASEIRAILATGLVARRLNQKALSGYFKYQSISGYHSAIQGIKEVPAGHYMSVGKDGIRLERYWNMFHIHPAAGGEKEIKERISYLVGKAVEQRMVSDVPIGAFLSGGIDSSVVVGIMSKLGTGRPVTFNICFEEKEYNESQYAELVARKFRTDHRRILLKPEALLDDLPDALEAMDTPSGDGVNSFLISKAVKNAGITVAISGVGGDELFAGYPFFKMYSTIRKYSRYWDATRLPRKIAGRLMSNRRRKEFFSIAKSQPWDVYPVLRQVMPVDRIRKLTFLEPGDDEIVSMLKVENKSIEEFPFLSQVSLAEYNGYTRQTLLKDMDQMSMASSLEVREPFFDHELVEYVLGVPDELKDPVYPKKLLIESFAGLIPPEIVNRKKQGFTLPWELWMKRELKSFCDNHIENICGRDFIRGEELKDLWTGFIRGDKNIKWMEVWLFIVLDHWLTKNEIC